MDILNIISIGLLLMFSLGMMLVAYFFAKLVFGFFHVTECVIGLFFINISSYILFFKNLNRIFFDLLFIGVLVLTICYLSFLFVIIIIEMHTNNKLIHKK